MEEESKSLKLSFESLNTDFTNLKEYFIKYKKYITGILGYKIDLKDDTIILSSLYAFDSEDLLIFKINRENLELVNNSFASQFNTEIQMYLVKGGSIPAFLSAVTLSLYNQKTFN